VSKPLFNRKPDWNRASLAHSQISPRNFIMNVYLGTIARSSGTIKVAAYQSGLAFTKPSETAYERSPIHCPDLTDEIVFQGILSPFQRSKIMRAGSRSRNNDGYEVTGATVIHQRPREWIVSVGGNTLH
jgi:hypothetical protein